METTTQSVTVKTENRKVKLSYAEVAEISRQARIELARRAAKRGDILEWGKALFPDKFGLFYCHELHGHFVSIREKEHTCTEAPRAHAKTTIKCFLIPLYQALNETAKFNHYLNVQATDRKAASVNMSIRLELERNVELRTIYGDQISARWTENQFVLKNGTIFTAVGAGQSIRGIAYENIRPDYIIVDDLYDEDDINNPESTQKKNAWFWGSLYPARSKSKNASVHVQGTAINAEDLLAQLSKQSRWESKSFKAIKNWETKEILWPELNTFDSLMEDMADMGSVIFYRELQNERRDETSSIVKSSWLTGWEYDPADLKFDKAFTLQEVLIGCDPSIGAKSEDDYTGIALILKCKHSDSTGSVYYIENLWNEHLSLDKRVIMLDDIFKAQPEGRRVSRALIEGIAGFKDFVAEVKRRTNIPVREISNVKDKIANLTNKSHYFENKKIFVNRNITQKLKDTLKYQLTTNHPKNDDLRDAVLLCLDDNRAKPGMWVID